MLLGFGSCKTTLNRMKLGDDFPYVCETCLGPNPYVRMLRLPPNARTCSVSKRPYTAFRWTPGPAARPKETIIAAEVAVAKNVCQTCLMDMEYNVPVAVRDALHAARTPADAASSAQATPAVETNRDFFWANQRQAFDESSPQAFQESQLADGAVPASAQALNSLSALSRRGTSSSRSYDRNLPRLCSFWVRKSCNRAANRTCPFRPCCGIVRFPELASSHAELLKALEQRLHADGAFSVMRDNGNEMEEIREAIMKTQQGSREKSIQARYHGTEEDELAQKYLAMAESSALTPPEDLSVRALWVGGLTRAITEADLHDRFYPFGEVEEVKMLPERKSAIVHFASRASAEEAASALHRQLEVRGARLKLWWAKPAQQQEQLGSGAAHAHRAAPYPSMNRASAIGARPSSELGKRSR